MRFFLSVILVSSLIAPAFAQPADKSPTAEEQKAIDLVTKAGGKAEIDPTLPEAARVSAKLEAATDATLLSLKKAPQIGALDVFDATRCTGKGFAAFKDLPQLRRLTLGKSNITVPCAYAIGQCKELQRLYLGSSGLTDAELVNLKPLSKLVWLDISDNPKITNRGMATVKSLERLEALFLAKTGITDEALKELKPLDGLRTLNVVGTKVTGDAAEKFADEMPNLRKVQW